MMILSVNVYSVLLPEDEDDPREYDPLALAAAIESKSAHPLANAVVSAYCGCIAEYEGQLANVKKVQVLHLVGTMPVLTCIYRWLKVLD